MEARMLGLEDFMTIHALVKRGVYLCDIAAQLGVHAKTVSRAVKRGGAPAGAAAGGAAGSIHIARSSMGWWPRGCGTRW
jgi:IS30 family transposase